MYMGIENELSVFYGDHEVHMDSEKKFQPLIRQGDYQRNSTSLRTKEGNGIYVDGHNLEVLTAPIAVNKGFATKLIDHLDIVRNRVVRSLRENQVTGYSMHWNISSDLTHSEDVGTHYWTPLQPVFNLFAQTPLSKGVLMREKTEYHRYELLGDSIPNRDQLRATALLIAAYTHTQRGHYKHPIQLIERSALRWDTKTLHAGRDTYIGIDLGNNISYNISAQDYLEITHKWLADGIDELGTKEEIQNLDDFITGKKQLEIDKETQYSNYKNFQIRGTSYPTPGNRWDPRLKINPKAKVPIEGKLLGKFASKKEISTFEWHKISYAWKHATASVSGVTEIYEHLQSIQKQRGFKEPWEGYYSLGRTFAFQEIQDHIFPQFKEMDNLQEKNNNLIQQNKKLEELLALVLQKTDTYLSDIVDEVKENEPKGSSS